MKAVIQRVKSAAVRVDGETVGAIGPGLLVLLGVVKGDGEAEAALLARKTADLRIFTDRADKMNQSVLDIAGGCLVVSNFTLCADTRKGNRPSFDPACEPSRAEALYVYFTRQLVEKGVSPVATGRFGAHMQVDICNDGPVTILLDTDTWLKKREER